MSILSELNKSEDKVAIALLEPLIERAPDIAMRVAQRRPFQDAAELTAKISEELRALSVRDRIDVFCTHPELAPENPSAMTEASQMEQRRLDLTAPGNAHAARLATMNAAYRAKFGFPFIVALSRHRSMESVFAEFEARLQEDISSELNTALEQVCCVSAERVQRVFGDPEPVAAHPKREA